MYTALLMHLQTLFTSAYPLVIANEICLLEFSIAELIFVLTLFILNVVTELFLKFWISPILIFKAKIASISLMHSIILSLLKVILSLMRGQGRLRIFKKLRKVLKHLV